MRANARLAGSLIVILGSAIYGVLVAYNPELARTIMVGYIGLVLTIFVVNELWRNR